MYFAYSALLVLVLVLGSPYWLYEMLRHGKYRTGLRERLGGISVRLTRISQPTIWIHAVSVGEVLAISELVRQLRAECRSYRVLVSTTTDTGQRLARQRFGEENVFYFPLDFRFAVRRWLQALRPELVVIAETELWPNFLRNAREEKARIAIVNARISDKSFKGYRRWKGLIASVLQIHSGLMKSNVFCVRSKYLFGGDRSGQGGRFAEEFCLSIPSGNSRRFMRSLTSLLWAAASSRAEGTTLLSLRSMESPLSWVITQRIFEILSACFNRETRCESWVRRNFR
jgi:hypothetical protein